MSKRLILRRGREAAFAVEGEMDLSSEAHFVLATERPAGRVDVLKEIAMRGTLRYYYRMKQNR